MPKDRADKQLQLIRRSLVGLARGFNSLARIIARSRTAPSTRRILNLSPKVRALRKLQGQYMGYLRNLKSREKARVKALRTSKGYPAAVKLAKKLATA